jgi:hypothetical protein
MFLDASFENYKVDTSIKSRLLRVLLAGFHWCFEVECQTLKRTVDALQTRSEGHVMQPRLVLPLAWSLYS